MSTKPIEQLIVVRRLFREAEHQAGVGDDINSMQATLLLDLAVESFLSAVVHHLRPDTDLDSIKFNTLLEAASDAVEAETKKRLPLGSKVRQLRNERNCVQHAAARRHPLEVTKLLAHAHEFLRQGFQLAFTIDFDTFSPIDGISSERVRYALKQAEHGLEQGDAGFCRGVVVFVHDQIVAALRGLKGMRMAAEKLRSVRRMSNHGTKEREILDAAERDVTSLAEELNEELVQFRDELVVVGLGLPLGDVHRFARSAGRRHGYANRLGSHERGDVELGLSRDSLTARSRDDGDAHGPSHIPRRPRRRARARAPHASGCAAAVTHGRAGDGDPRRRAAQ